MKNYFLIFLFLILSIKNYSQNNSKIDSLLSLLSHEQTDTSKVKLLDQISWHYINTDFDKALNYSKQALKMAQKLNFKDGIALSYTYIGYAQYRKGNYDDALLSINRAIAIYEILGQKNNVSKSFLTISQIYYEQSKYDDAINYCNKSILMKKESKDSILEINYLTLGIIYEHKGDYTKALENLFKSIDYCEKNNDLRILGSNYNNIAVVYRTQEQYDLALEFYQKAIDLHKKNGNKIGESQAINNMAVVYEAENHYHLALEYYNRALKIFKEINYLQGIAMAYTNISGIEINLKKFKNIVNQLNQAEKLFLQLNDENNLISVYKLFGQYYLAKNNFDLGIKYSEKAYEIAQTINALKQQSELAMQLSTLYERLYNYKVALKYYHVFQQIHDSIFNLQKTQLIEKMSNNYETLQREKEIKDKNIKIEILEKNKKISNLKMYILLFSLIILVVVTVFLIMFFKREIKADRKLREKENTIRKLEILRKEMEENALKNEIAYKNKEIQNFAAYIVDKNEFILTIQKALKDAKNDVGNFETKKEIQNIISLINNKMFLEKDRNEFLAYVKQINDNFYLKLQNKKLTETEIRIASLLRMGFSSKDISAILYITPKSVDTNRYRIRKKLGISSDINLKKFFNEI